MLKAIIFDAYGTLFDTGTGSVDAAAGILARCGRSDLDAKAFYARWKQIHREHINSGKEFVSEEEIYHRDLKRLYAEYGIDSDADADVAIMLAIQGTRIPYPETKTVLERLGKNFRLYTGSTTDTAPLEKDIKNAGLKFDGIFTSQSLRVYKPFPEFYTSILEAICLEPGEVLFAGDSLIDDVAGPQSVGIKVCWINRKCASADEHRPDYTISDLSGLIDIAESLL